MKNYISSIHARFFFSILGMQILFFFWYVCRVILMHRNTPSTKKSKILSKKSIVNEFECVKFIPYQDEKKKPLFTKNIRELFF